MPITVDRLGETKRNQTENSSLLTFFICCVVTEFVYANTVIPEQVVDVYWNREQCYEKIGYCA